MTTFLKNTIAIKSATRSFSVADFETVSSFKDFNKKGDALEYTGGSVGEAFKLYITAGIRLYYGDGNKQVQIMNRLLSVAQSIAGMNAKRLADYLECVTPHLLEAGQVKNAKAPQFYGKKGGTEQKPSELATYLNEIQLGGFLTANPDWTKYGKAPADKGFDAHAHARKLLKALDKANMTLAEYQTVLVEELSAATKAAA